LDLSECSPGTQFQAQTDRTAVKSVHQIVDIEPEVVVILIQWTSDIYENTSKIGIDPPVTKFVGFGKRIPWYSMPDPTVVEFTGYCFHAVFDVHIQGLQTSAVLLLYAETLNENDKTNKAYPYVDRVRERSNMRPLAEAHPEIGTNQELFLEQLKHERVIELSGELVRFFDLKRWGMFNSSNAVRDPNFETYVEGRSEVQPIPQSELDLNGNLIQNPRY
jgi:hypothetical protein